MIGVIIRSYACNLLFHLLTEIDECLSDPCLNDGTCLDEINGYTCQCIDGFTDAQCQTSLYFLCHCKSTNNLIIVGAPVNYLAIH